MKYILISMIMILLLINHSLRVRLNDECEDCKLKDEQYHKMIRKYNTMINNDSTHKWCIKLQ
jgi:hypothetical protein